MSGAGRFEFLDAVTSDLAFVARGPSVEAVFEASAEALLAATVENPDAVRRQKRCAIRLTEDDLELLLLRFLNELIYLRDADGLLFHPTHISIRRGDLNELDAELSGEALDPARHSLACDVKATTAHGLQVRHAPGGWEARVTFDV